MTTSAADADASIRIRGLETGDLIRADLPTPAPDEDGLRWRRSRIAQRDQQIVGTASIALASMTDSYFCEINVLPSHRRRGIGTRLYAAIHQLTDPRYPVLARAMSSQPLRRAFAESLGCSVVAHCPAPWIDPSSEGAQQWITAQHLPAGYTTVTVADQPDETILQAWTTMYVWVHQPFGTVHPDRVAQTWKGSSWDPVASRIALDHSGAIVAFSLVSPDQWEGRTMIISETVHADQPDGLQLVKATLAASLSVLAGRGVRRVELEGHTTDAHSPGLFSSLPSDGGDPMDILRLDPPTR